MGQTWQIYKACPALEPGPHWQMLSAESNQVPEGLHNLACNEHILSGISEHQPV